MKGYLFAGQGSQYVGMGRDLCEAFPVSRAIFQKADEALGFSLSKLCFEGPQQELTLTSNCQPAILTVSIAAFEAFKSINKIEHGFYAGLSLGEYSALVAAGVIGFSEAVMLVRRRGMIMEEQARLKPGKMLSVIGLDLALIREICQESHTEIANLNCPGQTVISGGPEEVISAQKLAQQKGAKLAVLLEVSGAFHSSYMNAATDKLAAELDKIKLQDAVMPIITNVDAEPCNQASKIRDNLVKQMASSVLWEDSMRRMIREGCKEFYEFGPGKVLRGLMRRIDPAVTVTNIEKKEDILKFTSKEE